MASGHDEWWEAAGQHLLDMGVPGTPVTAADVEIKIAVHMARNGIRHATVVLNNTPCKGRFGCDTLVPVVLPEGSSLTVHGVTPDGRIMKRTYTGGGGSVVELEIWGAEGAEEATLVQTSAELEALLERARGADYPILLEVLDAASPNRVILNVGLNGDLGVLRYAGGDHRRGVYSRNPEPQLSQAEIVLYYYMNSDREFPASAQCSADVVLRACVEFMETGGGLPSSVEWQPWPKVTSSS